MSISADRPPFASDSPKLEFDLRHILKIHKAQPEKTEEMSKVMNSDCVTTSRLIPHFTTLWRTISTKLTSALILNQRVHNLFAMWLAVGLYSIQIHLRPVQTSFSTSSVQLSTQALQSICIPGVHTQEGKCRQNCETQS